MTEINGRMLSEAEALSLELLTLMTRGGPVSERGYVAANAHTVPDQARVYLRMWVDEGLVKVYPGAVWSAIDGDVDGYRVTRP